MWKYIVLALSFVLAGCASLSEPIPMENGRLSPKPGHAIAIVALTGQSLNYRSAQLALHFDGPAGKTVERINFSSDTILAPSNDYLKGRRLTFSPQSLGGQVGNKQSARGRVLLMSLPAGEYKVAKATGLWLREGKTTDDVLVNVAIQQPFTLAAGEVVYLGQVHVDMGFRSTVNFSQNPERDFFNLEARSGVTDFSNIIMRPLKAADAAQ